MLYFLLILKCNLFCVEHFSARNAVFSLYCLATCLEVLRWQQRRVESLSLHVLTACPYPQFIGKWPLSWVLEPFSTCTTSFSVACWVPYWWDHSISRL